jgi:hypothetical protein
VPPPPGSTLLDIRRSVVELASAGLLEFPMFTFLLSMDSPVSTMGRWNGGTLETIIWPDALVRLCQATGQVLIPLLCVVDPLFHSLQLLQRPNSSPG